MAGPIACSAVRFWAAVTALTLSLAGSAPAAQSNSVYDSTCALCHQKGGAGLPGQFPRLAGRAAEIALRPGGSRYLIEVVLFGMTGKVTVDGTPIVGVMPSFTTLSDEQIASVLDYVTRLGGKQTRRPPLITAEAVANVRKTHPLTPAEVRATRDTVSARD